MDTERVEVLKRERRRGEEGRRDGRVSFVASRFELEREEILTSMLQTVIQLSMQSLTTSYSISFHPFILLSTKICGLVANAFEQSSFNSASLLANPDPNPPRANAARMMTGYPMMLASLTASS